MWTDGQIRIPIGFRVWKKGGPSKFELALELLSYARNRLSSRPQFVLFDSWYPSNTNSINVCIFQGGENKVVTG